MNEKEVLEWINSDDTLLFYNEKKGIVMDYNDADCILEITTDDFIEYNLEGNMTKKRRPEQSVIAWW